MHSRPSSSPNHASARGCPFHRAGNDAQASPPTSRWQAPALRHWNPLCRDPAALRSACYALVDAHGHLDARQALRHNRRVNEAQLHEAHEELRAYVLEGSFPCVGARSAFNRGRYRMGLYEALAAPSAVAGMCSDLYEFAHEFQDPGLDPVTFLAVFDEAVDSEETFERLLWRHLQAAHDFDRRLFAWDGQVSADPAADDFSFSIGGRAYFVVGLHPRASRLSRRAPRPTLVFNFHDQFEALRASGKYDGLQKAVRQRDINLQGSINPVLARFGEASEARQYSGANRGRDWKCPFHSRDELGQS